MLLLYLTMVDEQTDKLLFSEVYETYRDILFNYVINILHNYHDAEDVTQNAWITIAKNISHIHTENKHYMKAYLLRIAKHQSMDFLRKKRRAAGIFMNMDMDNIADDNALCDSYLYTLCAKEPYETVKSCIESLDERYSEVLNHYYMNTMKTYEIAKLLGTKEATVRTRLRTGRALLIAKLKEKGVEK